MIEDGGAGLPSKEALERNKNLAADALEALEEAKTGAVQGGEDSSGRRPCLVHCDDPFFLATSIGSMRLLTPHIEKWSLEYKQEEHVEDKKSTLGLAGEGTIDVTEYAADPLELRPQPLSVPAPLSLRDEKRWLGVLWRGTSTSSLSFKVKFGVPRSRCSNWEG